MKSGELNIGNSSRRCFFFTLQLDGALVGSSSPVKQIFYIVTPVEEATKEEAYLYLCHALLISKCYTNEDRLHKIFAVEFDPLISLDDFTRKHNDIFTIWELRRNAKKQQILYTNENLAQEALSESFPGKDEGSHNTEIVMSNMSSFQGSLRKSIIPTVQLNEGDIRQYSSSESYQKLKEELEACKALLKAEKEAKTKSERELRAEIISLEKRLQENGSKSAAQYNNILLENEKAMEGIELSFKKKEAELHDRYQKALQDRDVRIAQLSDVQLKLQAQNYQDSVRIQHLERALEQERANRVFYTTPSSSDLSSRLHVTLMEAEQKCSLLERENKERLEYQGKLETELRSAKIQIISQQSELERASMLLTALKDGLQLVKQSIPQLS